jgi:hypothetical protein
VKGERLLDVLVTIFVRMIKIEYPAYDPKIKTNNGKELIFDPFRKKWFLLTPEEWVRQNFLQYLTRALHYPVSLIAIEKEIAVGEMKKRFDIVVYKEARPYIVIECKEMNVDLTKNVLHQALRYNTNMQAQFIVITNGSYCFVFQRMNDSFIPADLIPEFVVNS